MNYTKHILSTFFVGALIVFSFVFSHQALAQEVSVPTLNKPIKEMTIPELQAKIVEILKAIQQLQALIAQLSTSKGISAIPQNYEFIENFMYGSSSQDVKYLQIILNLDPITRVSSIGPGSPGQETIYFGLKTKQAVVKFQEKYKQEILLSANATGIGFVEEKTRAKISQLLKQYRSNPGTTPTPTPILTPTSTPTPTPTSTLIPTPTPTPNPIVCGNNTKETGETCDGTDLGSFGNGINKCISYSSSYESGNLSCSSDCKTIITSNCVQKPISIPTLYVNLTTSLVSSNWSKSISGQSPLTGVDLKADITGTATGNINYSFDCMNDGIWDSPDNTQYKGITLTTKEFQNGCSYSTPGTYTARVKVERNIAPSAYDTVTITVSQPTPSYSLNIQAINGSVTKSPSQAAYTSGVTVTLTATAAAGYTFSSWSGDLTGTINPAAITMNSNKTITANFSQLSGTIMSVGSASGAAGATNIVVPITVSGLGTNKIYGVDISLAYDQNLITATGVQKGSITSNWNLEINISTAGQVRIALYSTGELISSGGEIAKIIFSVKSSVTSGSKSALTFTKADLNETSAGNKISGEFLISSVSNIPFNNNLASILSAVQEILKKIKLLF